MARYYLRCVREIKFNRNGNRETGHSTRRGLKRKMRQELRHRRRSSAEKKREKNLKEGTGSGSPRISAREKDVRKLSVPEDNCRLGSPSLHDGGCGGNGEGGHGGGVRCDSRDPGPYCLNEGIAAK